MLLNAIPSPLNPLVRVDIYIPRTAWLVALGFELIQCISCVSFPRSGLKRSPLQYEEALSPGRRYIFRSHFDFSRHAAVGNH
ncbi:hypothetical protein BH20PSE1_BH20PSE1_20750 [soil metagenome]